MAQQAQELRRLSDELATFKSDYQKRKLQDTYRFAEIAEAEDYKLNLSNSNRVMITGIKSILSIYWLVSKILLCDSNLKFKV